MADTCPTVKIRSDNPEHVGGFILINESDFGKIAAGGIPPEKHERFIDPPPGELSPPPPL